MTPRSQGLGTYLAARALPALATMGLGFLCIHALSAEDYAVYSMSLLAAGVAAGFAGGLSAQSMLRYSHELSAPALRLGLIAVPLAAAALAVPFVALFLAGRTGLGSGAWFAIAAVPAIAVMDTRRNFFIARAGARRVLALDACRAVAALLFTAVLLQAWGAQPAAPLLAQVTSVALCLLVVREGRAPAPQFGGPGPSRTIDAAYLGYGLGMAGWMALIVALSLAERTVVEAASGLAASGRYAAQADVVNAVFAAAGGALAASMMPAYLAQTGAPDRTALARLRRFALLGVLAIAALCVAAGALLHLLPGGKISQVLLGDLPTALTLVAAGTVWTAVGFVQKPLELRSRTALVFAGVLLALLLFVSIGPVLAERFGPVGVAAAKLVAGIACALFHLAVQRRSA